MAAVACTLVGSRRARSQRVVERSNVKGPRGTLKLVIPGMPVPGLGVPELDRGVEDPDTARDTPAEPAPAFSAEVVAPLVASSDAPERAKVATPVAASPAANDAFDPRRTINYADDVPMLLPDERIGDVRVKGLLARGGICEIFLAENDVLGAEVVVKVLSKRFASRLDVAQRLEVEARALAQLRGERGVVQIFTAGRDPRVGPYIVMELLKGKTLRELVNHLGGLTITKAVSIAILIADVMHSLHLVSIVHRDLKPENVYLEVIPGGSFRVVLLDLGCAKTPYSANTTDEKRVMGTVRYMSPEHISKQRVTAKSDIYSLGHMLYEMLLGEHAHAQAIRNNPDADAFTEMGWHVLVPVEALPELICPPRLWGVLEHMLAKDPAERFDSMQAVGNALRSFLEDFVKQAPAEITAEQRASVLADAPRLRLPAAAPAAKANAGVATAPRKGVSKNPQVELTTRILVPTLLVGSSHAEKRRYILGDGAVLGRDRGAADILLDDPSVSRKHVELRQRAGSDARAPVYEVKDLGSTNGIEIDGTPGRFGLLHAFQVLMVGDVRLAVVPAGSFDRDGRFTPLGQEARPRPPAAEPAALPPTVRGDAIESLLPAPEVPVRRAPVVLLAVSIVLALALAALALVQYGGGRP